MKLFDSVLFFSIAVSNIQKRIIEIAGWKEQKRGIESCVINIEKMHKNISDIRLNYQKSELTEEMIRTNPFEQFDLWMKEVLHSNQPEPTAMCLSTIGENGYPQSRMVLLKDYDNKGLVFYSNYESQKGRAIVLNPKVSLTFFWAIMERQVRIEGIASKLSEAESDQYFASRPRESQLSAIVSKQSTLLLSREEILLNYGTLEKKSQGKTISRPAYWGGYRITPNRFEFWQGRPSRLHDRFLYVFMSSGQWERFRLAP